MNSWTYKIPEFSQKDKLLTSSFGHSSSQCTQKHLEEIFDEIPAECGRRINGLHQENLNGKDDYGRDINRSYIGHSSTKHQRSPVLNASTQQQNVIFQKELRESSTPDAAHLASCPERPTFGLIDYFDDTTSGQHQDRFLEQTSDASFNAFMMTGNAKCGINVGGNVNAVREFTEHSKLTFPPWAKIPRVIQKRKHDQTADCVKTSEQYGVDLGKSKKKMVICRDTEPNHQSRNDNFARRECGKLRQSPLENCPTLNNSNFTFRDLTAEIYGANQNDDFHDDTHSSRQIVLLGNNHSKYDRQNRTDGDSLLDVLRESNTKNQAFCAVNRQRHDESKNGMLYELSTRACQPSVHTSRRNFDQSTDMDKNMLQSGDVSSTGCIDCDELETANENMYEGDAPSPFQSSHGLDKTPTAADCNSNSNSIAPTENSKHCLIIGGKKYSLRSTSELEEQYRSVFSAFPYFNAIQSVVYDDVLSGEAAIVVSAPTGSGKTVVFELSIIKLLMGLESRNLQKEDVKIVYIAPMKALCSERMKDWVKKFEPLGMKCGELTGDSEGDDKIILQKLHIVLTTPEKWDSVTRRYYDFNQVLMKIKLILIDEVHLLQDSTRGACMEAVISRMKNYSLTTHNASLVEYCPIRFLAVSATIPNAEDIAEWLGTPKQPAITHKMAEALRPVKLKRVVIGYPCSENWSDFRFDLSLNYKLASVLHTHSDQKPSLVFCSTRKACILSGQVLIKEARFIKDPCHKEYLLRVANNVTDEKLHDLLLCGVGFHHAGLSYTDRRIVEQAFLTSQLPVLLCTSTLAMGVNLPAHLVIVKSTSHYVAGGCRQYSDAEVMQMCGRAGRPQFESSATAVIMTRSHLKQHFETLLSGTQNIESCLHKHLICHLNAEIVLGTIKDIEIAISWLRSTYLYVRIRKNPNYYNFPLNLDSKQIEKKLLELCMVQLQRLSASKLISMDECNIAPTVYGRLMARFSVDFTTMETLQNLSGEESVESLLKYLSECSEFDDVQLRTSDKRVLNSLNKNPSRAVIRYPFSGRIKTVTMKISCLLQAVLGNITISDPSLSQEANKIFRTAQRIMKCACEYFASEAKYTTYLASVILEKCIRSRLWHDSIYSSRQLDGIGTAMSTALADSGITTLHQLSSMEPRQLEVIVNRQPPFGTNIISAARRIPHYVVNVTQVNYTEQMLSSLNIVIGLNNNALLDTAQVHKHRDSALLIVGDDANNILANTRIHNRTISNQGCVTKHVTLPRTNNISKVHIHVIHEHWAGVDVYTTFTPVVPKHCQPQQSRTVRFSHQNENQALDDYSYTQQAADENSLFENEMLYLEHGNRGSRTSTTTPLRKCYHKCKDKLNCAHICCKSGVALPSSKTASVNKLSYLQKMSKLMHQRNENDGNMEKGNFSDEKSAQLTAHTASKNTRPKTNQANNLEINADIADRAFNNTTNTQFVYKHGAPYMKNNYVATNHTSILYNNEHNTDESMSTNQTLIPGKCYPRNMITQEKSVGQNRTITEYFPYAKTENSMNEYVANRSLKASLQVMHPQFMEHNKRLCAHKKLLQKATTASVLSEHQTQSTEMASMPPLGAMLNHHDDNSKHNLCENESSIKQGAIKTLVSENAPSNSSIAHGSFDTVNDVSHKTDANELRITPNDHGPHRYRSLFSNSSHPNLTQPLNYSVLRRFPPRSNHCI